MVLKKAENEENRPQMKEKRAKKWRKNIEHIEIGAKNQKKKK